MNALHEKERMDANERRRNSKYYESDKHEDKKISKKCREMAFIKPLPKLTPELGGLEVVDPNKKKTQKSVAHTTKLWYTIGVAGASR